MPAITLNKKFFEELFIQYFASLTNFAYSYVRNEEAAKDVVHDTFLAFWNNRQHLDLSYSPKSYLYKLAQNYALKYLRHQRVVEMNEPEIIRLFESVANDVSEHETRILRIEEKLKQLPDKQREIFLKCVIEGKKYKEVAEEYGISLNTVKTHMNRALRFLKNELQDDLILLFVVERIKKAASPHKVAIKSLFC